MGQHKDSVVLVWTPSGHEDAALRCLVATPLQIQGRRGALSMGLELKTGRSFTAGALGGEM